MSLLIVCVWLSVTRGAEARDVTNPVGVWHVQADSAMCYATSVGDTSSVSGTLEIPQSGWNPKTRRFAGFAEMTTFPNVKPSFATTATVRGTWRLTGAFTADVTMTSLAPYTTIGLTGSWFYDSGDMTLSGAAPCPAADGYTPKSENLTIYRASTTVPTCAGGTSATVDERSAAAEGVSGAMASSGQAAPCPLNVTIGPSAGTTGMSDLDGVAQFGIRGVCLSGCRMLTVKVATVVPSAAPVDGATVSVTVTPIGAGIAPYPKGVDAGTGYLCEEAKPTRCSAGTLGDLTTDKHGQVQVVYWAPGIVPSITKAVGSAGESLQNPVNTEQTTLMATADASICTSRCDREHGSSSPTAFVWSPHELYDRTATFTQTEGQALADWAAVDTGLTPSDLVNGSGTPYKRLVDTYGQDVLQAAFTYLGVEYAAEGLELLGHYQDFKSLAFTDQAQQGFLGALPRPDSTSIRMASDSRRTGASGWAFQRTSRSTRVNHGFKRSRQTAPTTPGSASVRSGSSTTSHTRWSTASARSPVRSNCTSPSTKSPSAARASTARPSSQAPSTRRTGMTAPG